jgi:hypothetical protein
MFATIAIVLIVLWVLGHLVFKVAKGAIHILLVVGAVLLVMHFLRV